MEDVQGRGDGRGIPIKRAGVNQMEENPGAMGTSRTMRCRQQFLGLTSA